MVISVVFDNFATRNRFAMKTVVKKKDLGLLNTFRIQVSCACFVEYDSAEELPEIFSDKELPRPFFSVGGGSNLLFMDDFPGTVLHSKIRFIKRTAQEGDAVRVGAGVIWDDFCAWAAGRGLWGPENLSLIPGEVGAAAVQNIGAYGREVKDLVREVECFDIQSSEIVSIPAEECRYGYRESRFKQDWKGRFIITAVTFALNREADPELDYGHVREAVVRDYGTDRNLTPQQVRDTVIAIRRAKLPDPAEIGNAGSFFRNPYISRDQFSIVEGIASRHGYGSVPHFDTGDGLVKVPAAWLIEKCGWKGFREGNVGVYERQPLVLVNTTGEAAPKEVKGLEDRIVDSVRMTFGISLLPEVEHVK